MSPSKRGGQLTHIGGALSKTKHFVIPVEDLPRMLQYYFYAGDLAVLERKPVALWAVDSLGHYWRIPKKMLRGLLDRKTDQTV